MEKNINTNITQDNEVNYNELYNEEHIEDINNRFNNINSYYGVCPIDSIDVIGSEYFDMTTYSHVLKVMENPEIQKAHISSIGNKLMLNAQNEESSERIFSILTDDEVIKSGRALIYSIRIYENSYRNKLHAKRIKTRTRVSDR